MVVGWFCRNFFVLFSRLNDEEMSTVNCTSFPVFSLLALIAINKTREIIERKRKKKHGTVRPVQGRRTKDESIQKDESDVRERRSEEN